MDLKGLLDVLTSASGDIEALKSRVSSAQGAAISGMQSQVELIDSMGKNQQIIQGQQSKGEMIAQDNSRKVASSLGTNVSDNSEIMTLLGGMMKESALKTIQAKQEADRLAAGVASWNPLAIIEDIVRGDSVRQELNAATSTFETIQKQFNTLNNSTQNVAQTQKAIQQTKTEASLIAEQELIAQKAAFDAAEMKTKMAGASVSNLLQIQQLNAMQTSLALQAFNAAEQAEQRSFVREQRIAAAEERKAKTQDDTEIARIINLGRESLGLSPLDSTAVRRMMQLDKEALAQQYQVGSTVEAAGKPTYGQSPLAALSVVNAPGVTLAPGVKQLSDTLLSIAQTTPIETIVDQLYPSYKEQGKAVERAALLKDTKQHNNLRNQYLVAKARGDLSLIDPENQTNIYSLGTVQTLQGKPYLTQNKFLAETIAPQVLASEPVKFDPSYLFKMAYEEGLKKGKYTTQEIADGISWVAGQLALDANLSKNFSGLGLPALDKVVMPVKLDLGAYTKFADAVNLTDSAEIVRALVSMQVEAIKQSALEARQASLQAAGFPTIGGKAPESIYLPMVTPRPSVVKKADLSAQ